MINGRNKNLGWVVLIVAIVVSALLAYLVPVNSGQKVALAFEYAALIITFLFAALVLAAIAGGRIDISRLLEEKGARGGGASMSRFQFLIFTFVIALSFLLIVVNTRQFPDNVPAGVLVLLGISASTYAVSKGIQTGVDYETGDPEPPPHVTHTTVVNPPDAPGTVTHTTVVKSDEHSG